MTLYARLRDTDGVAEWFGSQPVDGAVEVDPREFAPHIERILAALPPGAALAPDDLMPTLLLNLRRTPGGEWVKRDPEPEWVPTEEELAQLAAEALDQARAQALERVADLVRAARLRLVTPLPGQDAIYAQKAAEAARYVAANPAPVDLADYPFLAAEVRVTAETPWQLAQLWLHMAAIFARVGAATEGARKTAEAAIAAAQDQHAVAAAEAAFAATLSRLGGQG